MTRLVLCIAIVAALWSPVAAATPPRMETRWPGVHLVWYDDLNLKSVVVEFDTFLAVVEVPHDDATARLLLATLRERFPAKPLRFAFHTHHHDHSIGALDPLFASGVTLVTTSWNLDQIRGLGGDPARLDAHVLEIGDTFELADATGSLRARVIRKTKYEVPTDEYIVVELPGPKALVSGCLFNKPLTYWEVVNTRKTSLAAFLADSRLDVRWLVPTNSARGSGFEDVCTREMLAETLEKGMKPAEIADRLQARTVAALRADLDALAAEFAAMTPRSYDLLVCGNYLKTRRKDFERAAVLFEVATRLFPKEVETWWHLGDNWSLAGDKAKARAAWTRALELATTDEERKEIQTAIAGL
jgi:hypothetical protein